MKKFTYIFIIALLSGCAQADLVSEEWMSQQATKIDKYFVILDDAITAQNKEFSRVFLKTLTDSAEISRLEIEIDYLQRQIDQLNEMLSDTLIIKWAELTIRQ